MVICSTPDGYVEFERSYSLSTVMVMNVTANWPLLFMVTVSIVYRLICVHVSPSLVPYIDSLLLSLFLSFTLINLIFSSTCTIRLYCYRSSGHNIFTVISAKYQPS